MTLTNKVDKRVWRAGLEASVKRSAPCGIGIKEFLEQCFWGTKIGGLRLFQFLVNDFE